MTSNFDIQLQKRAFKGNIVIAITDSDDNTTYFSQHKVDSGLTVDYEGYVVDASVNGTKIDLRDVKSTTPTLSFSLLDKDGDISALVASDPTGWMDYETRFYYGFSTGSYGWADYELISTTKITTMSKSANQYTFKCKAPAAQLETSIYTTGTTLNGDITDTDTTITVFDTSDFSSSGTISIENELITYSGKTATTFTGCTRAQLGSKADDHRGGEDVYEVTLIQDESMDIALDIILNQVGVASAEVDSDSFTDLRDGELSGDGDFKFYMYNIPNALEWIEENILLSTNTRLITKDGKISIALLDQVGFASNSQQINESHIIGDPGYSVNVDRVVNVITARYNFNWGTGKYGTVEQYSDATSIGYFGEKRALKLDMPGVTTANNGSGFASSKANKLLARLATPTAEISVTTLFNRFNIQEADQVYVEHRHLPQPGTGGPFAYMLEVLSRAPRDFKTNPKIKFTLAFTSYSALRVGLISPSPLITSVTSQKIFEVPDGTLFKENYYIRLFNDTTGDYYSDVANKIIDVTGNIITVENNFSTTLTTSVRVVFPEYADANSEQQSKYAWISPNTDEFADGTTAYKIIP